MIDADQLRATTFVRHVEIHDTLGSTNDRAAELARLRDIEIPAIVLAHHQTAGKGRGRNSWWSAEGALTFSLMIDAETTGVTPASWPQLSLAMAVAVCDAVQDECELLPGIKWPNDVLLNGRKVCGILIESPGGAVPTKDRLIIGIGINVNNAWQNAPAEAGANGIALCDVTGRSHELQSVLVGVLTAVALRISQIRTRDVELIRKWQRLDFLRGKTVLMTRHGRQIKGKCRGIADDGALVVDGDVDEILLYSGSVQVSA
jgi:BirA family transcriptional regulator, biotin operon repressor / biotin---[acetyl-CoA-carboxylase] ligase